MHRYTKIINIAFSYVSYGMAWATMFFHTTIGTSSSDAATTGAIIVPTVKMFTKKKSNFSFISNKIYNIKVPIHKIILFYGYNIKFFFFHISI